MFKSIMRSSLIGAVTAVLCLSTVTMTTVGCTSAQVSQVVAEVSAQIPTAIALTNTIVSVVSLFSVTNGTTTASVVSPTLVTTLTQDLNELQTLCNQYNATPNASIFTSITTLVDTIVTQGDSALLASSQITDPTSKAQATAVIGALDTILHVIDGYLQTAQSTAQVKATAARRQVKLKQISMYFNQDELNKAASAEGYTGAQVLQYETSLGF
jgi:hypothetical protein